MKNVDYKLIKLTNNLPKYDLGKMATDSTGFQQDLNPVSQGTIINPGADLSSMATGERQARIAGVTSDSLKLGTNLISKIPTQAAIDASKNGLISQGTGALGKASGAMKGLAAAGIATGVLEAGMGAVDVAKASNQMRNAYSPDEIQSWTGSQTGYGIGNNVYEQKTLDAANATNVINQRLKSASAGLTTGSASVGSGVGTAVGSALALGNVGAGTAMGAWLGPIGAAAGAVLGGLFGWIGGSVRRRKQEQAAKEEIARQQVGISNFNNQAISEANSLGMRQEYDAKFNRLTNGGMATAREGKLPGTIFNKYANKQYVNTAYGVQYREPNAITNGDELIIDTKTGFASDVLGDGKENKATFVRPQDAIINAKYADIARWAIATQNGPLLNNVITQQGIDMNRKLKGELVRYACGKMPKYTGGKNPEKTQTQVTPGMFFRNPSDYTGYNPTTDGNFTTLGTFIKNVVKDVTKKQSKAATDKFYENLENKSPYTPEYVKKAARKHDITRLPSKLNSSTNADKSGSIVPISVLASTYLSNMGTQLALLFKDKKQTPRRYNPYADSGAALMYASIAKPRKDYSAIPAINNSLRQGLYNNRNLAPGQRLIANDALNRGAMNAKAAAYNEIDKNYYAQLADYANKIGVFKAQDAQQLQAGNQYMDESFNRQLSKINDYNRSDVASIVGTNNSLAQNYLNLHLGNRAYRRYDKEGYIA